MKNLACNQIVNLLEIIGEEDKNNYYYYYYYYLNLTKFLQFGGERENFQL